MKIKKLTFIMENCEVIEIDGKYIGEFYCGKIKEKISRIGINGFGMWKECGEFYVEIHKDANQVYKELGVTKAFERLSEYPDICHIEIEFDEPASIVKYSLKWEGEFDSANIIQDSYISEKGHLYIKVGKKDLFKYFRDDVDTRDWEWI